MERHAREFPEPTADRCSHDEPPQFADGHRIEAERGRETDGELFGDFEVGADGRPVAPTALVVEEVSDLAAQAAADYADLNVVGIGGSFGDGPCQKKCYKPRHKGVAGEAAEAKRPA